MTLKGDITILINNMAQTLATYTTLVASEVDDTSAGAKVVIENSIKEIYMEVLRKVGQYLIGSSSQVIPTVVGTRVYTPNDFTEIYAVHYKTDGDYTRLIETTQDDFLNEVDADNGTPTKYFINGLNIELYCQTDTVGSLRVEYAAVPSLVNGSSVIPDRYNNVVKLGACYRFFAYEKGAEAENYFAWYQQALRDMELELSTRLKITRPQLF